MYNPLLGRHGARYLTADNNMSHSAMLKPSANRAQARGNPDPDRACCIYVRAYRSAIAGFFFPPCGLRCTNQRAPFEMLHPQNCQCYVGTVRPTGLTAMSTRRLLSHPGQSRAELEVVPCVSPCHLRTLCSAALISAQSCSCCIDSRASFRALVRAYFRRLCGATACGAIRNCMYACAKQCTH